MEYYVYKLAVTLLPQGIETKTIDHDLGVFSTLKKAEKILKEFVKKNHFLCPVYCYSIAFLPLNDDMEFSSARRLNIYAPDGELQISEMNDLSCSASWIEGIPFHIRAVIDVGPKEKSYFLLFNHWNYRYATKCARISFLEPKYELGTFYNKSVWFLNDQEKKMLMDFLKIPCAIGPRWVKNHWHNAICVFNNEVEPQSRSLSSRMCMPDYTELEQSLCEERRYETIHNGVLMWSKTRKALLERLAPSLKGRIDYHYAVYKHQPLPSLAAFHVLYIRVDQQVWFATNQNFYDEFYKKDFDERENSPEAAANEVIRETGFVQTGPDFCNNDALKYIHDYLNVLPYEDCLQSENYFIRLLALLDQRLGKRRLKKIVENIEQEPEWFRKWVRLRVGNLT